MTVTFLNWVEQQSPGWVDTHLEGYVNLAGPLLGLPKALSPMLSGRCLNVCFCVCIHTCVCYLTQVV